MITEVQLSNSRLHFQYLRRIICEMGNSAGLARRDAEDMGKAVLDVCQHSFRATENSVDSRLSVMLGTEVAAITADIIDRNLITTASGDSFDGKVYHSGLNLADGLVDSVELIRGIEETTIRLKKMKSEMAAGTMLSPIPGQTLEHSAARG